MARAFDRSSDLERARLDPSAVFSAPEQVLATPELTRDDKIEILRRWSYDAGELAVAEEEGMGGGEPARRTAEDPLADDIAGRPRRLRRSPPPREAPCGHDAAGRDRLTACARRPPRA